jgi:tyrosine-protein kinase Etk/Wzc
MERDTPLAPETLRTPPSAAANGSAGASAGGAVAPAAEPSTFWLAAGAIRRARWFIAGMTALAVAGSVALALVLPVQYAASARVLLPESGGGGLSALIGDLSPVGGALLGGGAKDYSRYLAILTSRSMGDAVVRRFDLVRRYDKAEDRDPAGAARLELSNRTGFEVDLRYEYLSITVLDEDPRRAAEITNFYVDELNRRNQELTAQNAGGQRLYIEERYGEAERALDSLRAEMQRFQEANGVVELPAMAEAMIASLATARGEVARAEVEYEALRAQYGDDNPQVQAARDVLQAMRRTQQDLISGRDDALPIPMRRLPALGNEYARIYQEVLTQTKIIEATRPLLEQARFAEEQERMAVQVLDRATPPLIKAKPQRAVLVLITTFSAFVVAVCVALAFAWLRRNRARLASQLRAA